MITELDITPEQAELLNNYATTLRVAFEAVLRGHHLKDGVFAGVRGNKLQVILPSNEGGEK